MADQGLQFQIGADVSSAVNGMKQVEGELQQVANRSFTTRFAVQNLGNVIRDLPFASANPAILTASLDHVVASMVALKSEAGSMKGALAQLGASLTGGGGLLLAFNLVTSAIAIFGSKLLDSKKPVAEAKDANDTLAKSFADSAVKLTTLVGVITNINTKHEEQQRALKVLNDEYGSYLKSLGIEEVTVKNVTQAYDALIDDLLKQAVVKGIQDEISEAVKKTSKSLIELQKNHEQLKLLFPGYEDILQKQHNKWRQLAEGIDPNNKALETANFFTAQYTEKVAALKKELSDTLAPLLSLTTNLADLGIKVPKTPKDKINLADLVTFDMEKRRAELNKEITEQFSAFRNAPQISQNVPTIEVQLIPPDNKKLAAFQNALAKATSFKGILDVAEQFNLITKGVETAAFAMDSLLTPAFQNFFDAVEHGLNPIKAFFKSLIQSVDQLISKLIAAAIEAAIVSAIFPGAGGFGAVFGKIFGFAEGGLVNGATPAIVGERGPEVIMPLDRAIGMVQSAVNQSSGNATGNFILKGNDLVLAINRTNKTQSRGF